MSRSHTFPRTRTALDLLVLACLVAFAFAGPKGGTNVPPRGNGSCIVGDPGRVETLPLEIGRECGNYDTADKANARMLADHWRKWTGEYRDGRCRVPARTCRRFACWNTSGLYLCNDNDHGLDLDCADGFDGFAKSVAYGCCHRTHLLSPGGSGHVVTSQGYRVVVAYANCRHHRDQDVPAADGANPNGRCVPGTILGAPCHPGSERTCSRRKSIRGRAAGWGR